MLLIRRHVRAALFVVYLLSFAAAIASSRAQGQDASSGEAEWTITITPRFPARTLERESIRQFGGPVALNQAAVPSANHVVESSILVESAADEAVPMADSTESVKALEVFRQRERNTVVTADANGSAIPSGTSTVTEAAASERGSEPDMVMSNTASTDSAAAGVIPVSHRTYAEVYRSIPFSRSEFDANPGYRHLATMELLLGQLHPVIVAPAAPAPARTEHPVFVVRHDRSGTWFWSPLRR